MTLALGGVASCSQSPEVVDMKQGEILPSAEMSDRHHLTAANRPNLKLDPNKVPKDLADLIPFAERWGVGDDLIRHDLQSTATEANRQALARALTGRNARITEWLDSQPPGVAMSDEAAAFMYMQAGLDEMGLWVD